jgi:RNA polymerase sigma factor (sigma-70 family)
MVRALEGLHNLRKNEYMKTWIFAIAKAEAKRYYSEAKKHIDKNVGMDALPPDLGNEVLRSGKLEDFTQAIENKELIRMFLNKLSEEEQRIYILHYLYDMSFKEISEILHMNHSTVRSIHVRGIYKFKMYAMKGLLLWTILINMKNY